MRSCLSKLDLNEDKLEESGKEEREIHMTKGPGMKNDSWNRVQRVGSETCKGYENAEPCSFRSCFKFTGQHENDLVYFKNIFLIIYLPVCTTLYTICYK